MGMRMMERDAVAQFKCDLHGHATHVRLWTVCLTECVCLGVAGRVAWRERTRVCRRWQ